MEWTIRYDQDAEALLCGVRGELTTEGLNRLAAEALKEATARACRKCLMDYSEVTRIIGTLEIYNRPTEVSKLGVTRRFRIALLVKREDYENLKFAENVFRNNGFDYQIFVERDAALAFLSAHGA
jgi:hypothetical protein